MPENPDEQFDKLLKAMVSGEPHKHEKKEDRPEPKKPLPRS